MEELVREGQIIQQHLPTPTITKMGVDKFNTIFTRLMYGGKIKVALNLLSNFEDGGGVLPLNAMIGGEKLTQLCTGQTAGIEALRMLFMP